MADVRILLVDDDRTLLRVLSEVVRLRFPAADVAACGSANEALRRIEDADFDVMVTDVRMPGADGLFLLQEAHRRRPETNVVLMTGLDDRDVAVRALRGGAFDYLQKPVDEAYLTATIARALHARAASREIEAASAALQQRAAELEHIVQDQTRELREANRLKDEFLATVSHELRTPLTAVLGWSRLLLRGRLDEPTRNQAIASIERNATHQARLIEDLLDLSRVMTGKLRLAIHSVDLGETVATCVAEVEPTARAKQVILDDARVARGAFVAGDPDRLQQVIGNLLSNAIKFTPEGGHVWVETALEDANVVLRIRDDGVGIAPDLLPHVFDRFRQGDAALSRSRSGLGLGLAITHEIVALHSGTVAAESAGPNEGATMTVTLPRAAASSISQARNGGRPPRNPFSSVCVCSSWKTMSTPRSSCALRWSELERASSSSGRRTSHCTRSRDRDPTSSCATSAFPTAMGTRSYAM